MAKLSGSSAVIAEAVAKVPRARVEQPGLPLAVPGSFALELQETPHDRAGAARRAGRPKGSKNRRSEELCRFVLSQHGHPLMALAQVWGRPVHDLAAELGVTAGEAMGWQIRAAGEALPYFESKKPVAIQTDGRLIQLVIHEGHAGEPAPAVDAPISLEMDEG